MISFLQIVATFLIALAVGSLFYYSFKRRGPWGSFWSFLLIIFLGVLLFGTYAEPVGPLYYGVAWLDLLIIGLIFAFLLAASSNPYPRRMVEKDEVEPNPAAVSIGIFFWVSVIFFLIVIFAQALI